MWGNRFGHSLFHRRRVKDQSAGPSQPASQPAGRSPYLRPLIDMKPVVRPYRSPSAPTYSRQQYSNSGNMTETCSASKSIRFPIRKVDVLETFGPHRRGIWIYMALYIHSSICLYGPSDSVRLDLAPNSSVWLCMALVYMGLHGLTARHGSGTIWPYTARGCSTRLLIDRSGFMRLRTTLYGSGWLIWNFAALHLADSRRLPEAPKGIPNAQVSNDSELELIIA